MFRIISKKYFYVLQFASSSKYSALIQCKTNHQIFSFLDFEAKIRFFSLLRTSEILLDLGADRTARRRILVENYDFFLSSGSPLLALSQKRGVN